MVTSGQANPMGIWGPRDLQRFLGLLPCRILMILEPSLGSGGGECPAESPMVLEN